LVVLLREGNPRAAAEHPTDLVESFSEEKRVAVSDEIGVRSPTTLGPAQDVGEPARRAWTLLKAALGSGF